MTVILFDKRRETYKRIDKVFIMEDSFIMQRSRPVNAWAVTYVVDGNAHRNVFKKVDFDLHRVEIGEGELL